MLQYLDQPLRDLAPGPRVTTLGLRLWAQAMRTGASPMPPLQMLLVRAFAPGALWPAHALFHWTTAHTSRQLNLGCPCCGRIGEDEALLLAAVFATSDTARAASLGGLVAETAIPCAAKLAHTLEAELRHVSLAAFAHPSRDLPRSLPAP